MEGVYNIHMHFLACFDTLIGGGRSGRTECKCFMLPNGRCVEQLFYFKKFSYLETENSEHIN